MTAGETSRNRLLNLCFNLSKQEILEQNLTKLVDDDEADSIPIPRTSSKYKVTALSKRFVVGGSSSLRSKHFHRFFRPFEAFFAFGSAKFGSSATLMEVAGRGRGGEINNCRAP